GTAKVRNGKATVRLAKLRTKGVKTLSVRFNGSATTQPAATVADHTAASMDTVPEPGDHPIDEPVAADPFEVFRSPAEVSTPSDPWQQFMAADDVGETSMPMSPPPAPEAPPTQPAWTPSAEPVTAVQSDSAQPAAAASAAPAPSGGPGRSGGLARRVPGASLAESRGGIDGAAAAPPPDRSADSVRSMLSSFQAGRDRGRVDPSEERSSNDDEVSSSTVPNAVHDGRFPQ
ncbi:MAG: hypothetical protein ACK4V6_19375, partial [Microthrixaceae bacterium]